FRNPKIQDVVVFGIPDEKYGEQIASWIKLKEVETSTAEKIQKFFTRKEVMSNLDLPEQVTA
ncbi:MAG: hypothetical protein MUP90_00395, partial [Gammaproteobacteria bacterium]|nr:hypothetical protein [Gammaproteobacteria bacterium]